MPRLYRDFECSCGHHEERMIDTCIDHYECRNCGGEMKRVIGMPTVKLEGISGDFPGAHHRWATIREERHRQQARKR